MHRHIYTPNTSPQLEIINTLGLKNEWLQEIGKRALAAYNQTTANDAASAAGSYAYFAAVRGTRDILRPQGWEPDVRHNLELTENSESNISIIVSSGDKYTGIESGTPKTKNTKGNQTHKIVSFNANQYRLPTMEYKVKNISLQKTWILLYHVDMKRKEMRIELSLPIKIDIDDLRVSEWHQRIIVPSIDFRNTPSIHNDDETHISEYKVELQRK